MGKISEEEMQERLVLLEKGLKACPKCGLIKKVEDFNKTIARYDKLDYRCKACVKSVYKKRYENEHEKIVEQHKNWREKNPEKLSDWGKIYQAKKKSEN